MLPHCCNKTAPFLSFLVLQDTILKTNHSVQKRRLSQEEHAIKSWLRFGVCVSVVCLLQQKQSHCAHQEDFLSGEGRKVCSNEGLQTLGERERNSATQKGKKKNPLV